MCQKRLSTRAFGAADGRAVGPPDVDGAGEANAAEAVAAEAPAAAAIAAVRTVLREVGLVMGVTPGLMR